MTDQIVERGKPADYGQELTKRRSRIAAERIAFSGRLILDFGAGNGAQTIELQKLGCRIVACDVDQTDLDILSQYVTKNHIESIKAIWYDGATLPFPDETFDVVVSFAVLEHVHDESLALREIRRVLKAQGEFVISVPNKWWIFETHGARLPYLHWNRVPFFSWLPSSIHRRYANARIYRKKEIVQILKTHGFEVLDSWYMTAPMDMVSIPWLQRVLRTFIFRGDRSTIPFLATEVFVQCRKAQGNENAVRG